MTSGVPPAIRRQRVYPPHTDRLTLLRRADDHTTELAAVMERLVRIEVRDEIKPRWQQCAMLARRIRGQARHQADEQRRRAKRRAA